MTYSRHTNILTDIYSHTYISISISIFSIKAGLGRGDGAYSRLGYPGGQPDYLYVSCLVYGLC